MRLPLLNPLLTCVAAACLTICGTPNLLADETLRHIQQELRDQGFYYGSIDGSPGDETTQAIKRYQIRNGLTVTGQLNDETRKSIDRAESAVAKGSSSSGARGSASSRGSVSSSSSSSNNDDRQYAEATPPPLAPPPPDYQDQAPVVRSAPHPPPDTDSGDENDAPAPPARPDLRVPPGGSQPGGPVPPPGAVQPSPELTAMFARTPYEFAPPPVQSDILRRAQAALLRDGFYDGQADGVPGPRTSEALANLQQVSHIRASGRLDVQTLAILRLLPRGQPGPPRGYYYGPGPGYGPGPAMGPGGVYQGRIVQ